MIRTKLRNFYIYKIKRLASPYAKSYHDLFSPTIISKFFFITSIIFFSLIAEATRPSLCGLSKEIFLSIK